MGNAMDTAHGAVPAACDNCQTRLQGRYCHVCGQHAINPMRHFGHAVEDVFESFWHLDGRVFRTLRHLLVPGRVACNYLAGQRVRYVAPLRLFVVVSLLTFFVGTLFVAQVRDSKEPASVRVGATDATEGFERDATAADVDRRLARILRDLEAARRDSASVPVTGAMLDAAERKARARASQRLRELGGRASAATAASTPPGAAASTPATPEGRSNLPVIVTKYARHRLRDRSRPWHPDTNPVDVAFLPGFADGWANRKLANIERNGERIEQDGSWLAMSAFSVAPTSLFLLMPVFALLLKLVYVRRDRGVLEHLVVALYSHVYLLLTVLALFVASLLQDVSPRWLEVLLSLLVAGLLAYVPVYLLLMQKRVYGQSWGKTLLKYLLIGGTYAFLFFMAIGLTLLLTFFRD